MVGRVSPVGIKLKISNRITLFTGYIMGGHGHALLGDVVIHLTVDPSDALKQQRHVDRQCITVRDEGKDVKPNHAIDRVH